MWITTGILLYLLILGILDLKKRRIPVFLLGIGGVLSGGIGIYECIQGEATWMESILGLLPGAFLILVAWISRKAGYADGIVLMQLGVCMGYRTVLFLLCISMFFLSGISIALLLARKVGKETKMPYLTFLAMVFLMWKIWGG